MKLNKTYCQLSKDSRAEVKLWVIGPLPILPPTLVELPPVIFCHFANLLVEAMVISPPGYFFQS